MEKNRDSEENKIIRDNFESAQKNIEKGTADKNTIEFENAIKSLLKVIEYALSDFFNEYINDFSNEERGIIKNNINILERGSFDKLPLGKRFIILGFEDKRVTPFPFIEKVEEKYNISLKNLKQLRDSDFVKIRNEATHIKKTDLSLSCSTAITQFNRVSAMLTELGYNGYYDYETCRYNNFVDRFRFSASVYSSNPDPSLKIDQTILSEFFEASCSISLLEEIQKSPDNFLILGEGGIGKSTILNYIAKTFNEKNQRYCKKTSSGCSNIFLPIPVLISASKLKITGTHIYDIKDFIADIGRLTGKPEFDILDEAEKLAREHEKITGINNRPVFLLLLDGFNEISIVSDEISRGFLSIFKEFSSNNIQILVTSRTKFYSSDDTGLFREVIAKGLSKEKIESYLDKRLHESGSSDAGKTLLMGKKMHDVLSNPMLLTLFTGYQYDMVVGTSSGNIRELSSRKKLAIIDSPVICKSYILWNFIQYKVLYDNIFRPLLEEKQSSSSRLTKQGLRNSERDQDKYLRIISDFVPRIAWEMISSGHFKIAEDDLAELLDESADSREIIQYLTDSVCLLKNESGFVSFEHQNFRDFFAACYFIRDYMPLTGARRDEENFQERLRLEVIPSDLKNIVGELLGELENERSVPLRKILKKYQDDCTSGPIHDHTVENIFEIYKSLDTLRPAEFIHTDLERLNFNDIETNVIIHFVRHTLDDISVDDIISDVNPLNQKNKKSKSPAVLFSLFMLSARCANNLRKEDIENFSEVWFRWIRAVYKNKTKKPSTSALGRFAYLVLSNKKITSFLLSTILYQKLSRGNVGIGNKGFLSIFKEVSDHKHDYQNLMQILEYEGRDIDNAKIVDSVYIIGSRNDYAANFICFILDYYLFYNLEGGLDLINRLRKKMEIESDREKKTIIKFRMMSGMNYCVQESWCHGKNNKSQFNERFGPIMRDFLESELQEFSEEIAGEYRTFKYQYYFPFGILFSFDNGIDSEETIKKTLDAVFFEGDTINIPLFQKLILDIACISTGTFFIQNEMYERHSGEEEIQSSKYLGRTFAFFEDLLFTLYPASTLESPYEKNPVIWESLVEALAVIYSRYPLKTEKFLDRINRQYREAEVTDRRRMILNLKNSLKAETEKRFVHLCQAGLNEEKFSIKKFVENYQNVLVFADLANNVFISFPNVTKTLILWGNASFYKNIDAYKDNPQKFISQTLNEVMVICESKRFYEIDLDVPN
nr:hypothetical protein [uncultured Methanoregula sp.]